jgi:hypothetical protein
MVKTCSREKFGAGRSDFKLPLRRFWNLASGVLEYRSHGVMEKQVPGIFGQS